MNFSRTAQGHIVKRPTKLKISPDLDRYADGLRRLVGETPGVVRALERAYRNQDALKAKAWDEGFPGDNEAFVGPVIDLEQQLDSIIETAKRMKDTLYVLKSKDVSEWG